ncbi:flagella basal body P-ring formation protein FlgA [Sphingomonas flavalba]|uniref:flagella basal body P-ring formation protein FlgA n=1 Tax=Sphingomonas flavalba TaxID=2559804 RepID=UPI0039E05EFE
MIRFVLLAALATPAAAATDLGALERAVVQFSGAPVGAEGGPLAPIDRRLKLADCSVEPVLSWRSERQDAVVVQCPGGWRLFVPIKAQPMAAGAVATIAARTEPVIRRGDPVTIVAESAGFSVSSDGIAIADAAPGARVGIRIAGARTPVQAIAVEPGKATLPGW